MKVIIMMCITEYVTPLRKLLKKSTSFLFSELPVVGHQRLDANQTQENGWLGRAMEGVQSHGVLFLRRRWSYCQPTHSNSTIQSTIHR